MNHTQLENELTRKMRRRRCIEGGICLLFAILAVVSVSLREASKQVEKDIFGFTYVSYNEAFDIPIILGIFGAVVAGVTLFVDFIESRWRTVEKDGFFITVYESLGAWYTYLDGNEIERKDALYTEFRLPNGVKVTVNYLRGVWSLARITYSDNTPSIEI